MTGYFTEEGLYRCPVTFPREGRAPSGSVSPEGLLHALEEIAGAHYDALDLGRDTAVAHGCFWALIRTELEQERPVYPETELLLDTWSGRQSHGLFWRHYRLQDGEGQIFLRAVSVWVLMDLTGRTLSRDRSWVTDRGGESRPGELPAGLKKPPFPEELPGSVPRTVTPGDTDINGHVNNARYLRWAEELLPAAFRRDRRLRRLWIEYKKEVPSGETVLLRWRLEGDTLFLRGGVGEQESFAARCEYDPIQQ